MLHRCKCLEHLELTDLQYAGMREFLGGESGLQLRSLSLKSLRLCDEDPQLLAELLMNTECLPRLHKVRLFSENGLEQLDVALGKNKTIALVELRGLESRYVGVSKDFDKNYNGPEVEMTTLSLTHKLAFISVFTNEASRVAKASSNTME